MWIRDSLERAGKTNLPVWFSWPDWSASLSFPWWVGASSASFFDFNSKILTEKLAIRSGNKSSLQLYNRFHTRMPGRDGPLMDFQFCKYWRFSSLLPRRAPSFTPRYLIYFFNSFCNKIISWGARYSGRVGSTREPFAGFHRICKGRNGPAPGTEPISSRPRNRILVSGNEFHGGKACYPIEPLSTEFKLSFCPGRLTDPLYTCKCTVQMPVFRSLALSRRKSIRNFETEFPALGRTGAAGLIRSKSHNRFNLEKFHRITSSIDCGHFSPAMRVVWEDICHVEAVQVVNRGTRA